MPSVTVMGAGGGCTLGGAGKGCGYVQVGRSA